MKYLKFILLFIFFVAAIFMLVNWHSIFTGGNGGGEFVEEDVLDIAEECEKIRKGWSAVNEWDQELYDIQRADIDQSKSMGLFSLEGYNTVNNTLRETAANKACDAYTNELKSGAAFKDANLAKHYKGVMAIMKAEGMEKDPRVTHIVAVNKLYTNIKSFVNSSHTISPYFDTKTADWKSFVSAQNAILSTASNYKKDPLYSEVQLVPGFAAGLDEGKLKSVTNPQRARFYEGLSQQIVSHFSTVDVTQENYNLLNQIYKNFYREDSDHGLDGLARALVDLKSKVDNKED